MSNIQSRSNLWSTSGYDLYNQHGVPLCHRFGCRKHKHLHMAFNGLFCAQHMREIERIRSRKSNHLPPREDINWRLEEARARKILDSKHLHHMYA